MSAALETALKQIGRDYRVALDRLRDLATDETEDEVYTLTRTLRECVDFVGCLRRLTQGRSVEEIHKAFGAPGDYGYETPIGDALSRVYRGEP